MSTLFELTRQFQDIESRIAATGGEITPEIDLMLTEFSYQALAAKVDGYQFVISRLENTGEYFSNLAKKYKKIADSYDKAGERMLSRVKQVMLENDVKVLAGDECYFRLQATKGKMVIDETKLPPKFIRVVERFEPDRERIEEVLKGGGEVPGARLDSGTSLRRYSGKPPEGMK
jgi:hypothetical protein